MGATAASTIRVPAFLEYMATDFQNVQSAPGVEGNGNGAPSLSFYGGTACARRRGAAFARVDFSDSLWSAS